jgi:hypothetical protein
MSENSNKRNIFPSNVFPRGLKKFKSQKDDEKILELIEFFKTSQHKFLIDGKSFCACPVGFLFYYDDSDYTSFEISKKEYEELRKHFDFKIVPFVLKSFCHYGDAR